MGNNSGFAGSKKINISTFEKYLNSGEISKVTIINKTLAEVTLTENALMNEIHRDVSNNDFFGNRNLAGPHYNFEVGDLELFQRKLENAESNGIIFVLFFLANRSKRGPNEIIHSLLAKPKILPDFAIS